MVVLVVDLIIISSRERAINDLWLKGSVSRLGIADSHYIVLIFYNLPRVEGRYSSKEIGASRLDL